MPIDLYGSSIGLDPSAPLAGLDLYAPDPNAPGPFRRGFGAGMASVKSNLAGAGALALHAVGATELEKSALDYARVKAEEAAPLSQGLEQVDWSSPGSIAGHFKWLLGNALPSLGLMAAGGIAGRGFGALAGRGAAVTRAATFGGAVAPDVALEAGGIYPAALETGVESPALRAAVGGTAAAAFDFIPLLAAEKYLKAAGKGGFGAVLKGMAKGAPVGAGLEGAQELIQSIVERTAAGLPLTGPEATSDYWNSLAGGAAPGVVFGAGIGGFRGRAAKPTRGVSAVVEAVPSIETPLSPITGPEEGAAVTLPAVPGINAPIEDIPRMGTGVPNLGIEPAQPKYDRLEAPIAGEADAALREGLLHQQNRGFEQLSALKEELKKPEAERRPEQEIRNEMADTLDKLAAATQVLTHVDATMKARQIRAETSKGVRTPRTGTAEGVLIGGTEVTSTDAAEAAVAAVKRGLGMLVSSREARLVPAQTPREVALERVREGGRGAVKTPSEQDRQSAVETAVIQAVASNTKELVAAKVKTEGGKMKLTRLLTDALNSVATEAAALPSVEEAQAYIAKEVPKALKGRVMAVDADEVARVMSVAAGQAHTLYSKGAAQESRAALTQDEFNNLPEDARFAALDTFNDVMRERGFALRTRLVEMLGNDPALVIKTFQAEPGSPIGSYTRVDKLKSVITLALNAKNELSVADHEGFHYAEDRLLTSAERQVVSNALKEGRPLYRQLIEQVQQYDRENKTNLADEIASIPAEARAYAFEFWRRGELRAEGALAGVFRKLQEFFEKVANFIRGQGFQSIEDVFTALDRGQYAERVRGQESIFGGGVLAHTAFHGTPHVWLPEPGFPHGRPRLDKIGTGEGAQAYGWGWYSAETKGVGEAYKNMLGRAPGSIERTQDIVLHFLGRGVNEIDAETIMRVVRYVYAGGALQDAAKTLFQQSATLRGQYTKDENALAHLEGLIKTVMDKVEPGSLYRLEIPDDVLPKLLDWDKPLNQQEPGVRKLLLANGVVHEADSRPMSALYAILSSKLGSNNMFGSAPPTDDKAASEYLASVGIPGNKYLDQRSRATNYVTKEINGKFYAEDTATGNTSPQFLSKADLKEWTDRQATFATSNFVIWDQKVLDRIALLERNGEKLDAMRGVDTQFSEAGGSPWYRSVLTDSVAAMATKMASAQGWKDQIRGLVAAGKAKQVEVDAVGVTEFLDLQQGKVTKDQVVSFLRENGVKVEEMMLGEGGVSANERRAESLFGRTYTQLTDAERDEVAQSLRASGDINSGLTEFMGEPKFAEWQLPGGKNYRELVLSLPPAEIPDAFHPDDIEITEPRNKDIWVATGGIHSMNVSRAQAPTSFEAQIFAAERFNRIEAADKKAGTDFSSPHFDQPNVLAHIRFNERTDTEGKRVLFLEEIQSDWAQKGRKEGFGPLQTKPSTAGGWEPYGRVAIGGIPSAPFVTKTETWVGLSLKRMIRYAAENGFDKVAWTTGEQQAERYKEVLRKVVDRIEWEKTKDGVHLVGYKTGGQGLRIPSAEGRAILAAVNAALERNDYLGFETLHEARSAVNTHSDWRDRWPDVDAASISAIQAYRDSAVAARPRNKVVDTTQKENAVSDAIGKTMADQIKNDPNQTGVIEGDDISVDDIGMTRFYGEEDGRAKSGEVAIVPNTANEVLRKLGGGKVEQINIGSGEGTERGRIGSPEVIRGLSPQPGFAITPELARRAAEGLPLFSKAATDMERRMEAGELEHMQMIRQAAKIMDAADLSDITERQAVGILSKDMIQGNISRFYDEFIARPEYVAHKSRGYANVQKVLGVMALYKEGQVMRWTKEALPSWHDGNMTRDDEAAVAKAMLDITSKSYAPGSPDYNAAIANLSKQQRLMFDQATNMISTLLEKEFEVDKKMWEANLPAEEAAKLVANRREWLDANKGRYTPERRYGEHTVDIFYEAPGKDGRPQHLTVALEMSDQAGLASAKGAMYRSQLDTANSIASEYRDLIARTGAPLQVEVGIRHKTARDTTISIQQFLDTARRNGIILTQVQRENIVRSMTDADSIKRNRMMRRKNILGYSQDITRIVHEFAVGMTSKMAYNMFAPAIDAATDGKPVDAHLNPDGEAVLPIDNSRNLWKDDGAMSGFHRNLADELADYNVVPDQTGTWSKKLRGAGMVYFLGMSLSQMVQNSTQVPLFTVPKLSQYTSYPNALTTTLAAFGNTWANIRAIRDINILKNPDIKIDFIDAVPGLRQALVQAARGPTMDTEIHQILGIAQGSKFAKSRKIQKAMDIWMAPFRVSEQANRIASFIAAYKIAKQDGITAADGSGVATRISDPRALYEFAAGIVGSTQNTYNPANRPPMARHSVGALLFMFKSFPLFALETMHLMYKENPKVAVYMLLGFTAASGIMGLPFVQPLEDLIDTIAQRLFNSPFNSRRAMRNMIKDASEALVGADFSSAVLHGGLYDLFGADISSRLGFGNFIPGTRLGAADADYGRQLEQILGAPFSMVAAITRATGPLLKGDFEATLRQGAPIAVRNLVKGFEDMNRGFATDNRGQKLVPVTGIEAAWQLAGFSSNALSQAYEADRIDKQTSAFYTQAHSDFTQQLVRALKDSDASKAQETMEAVQAWNRAWPQYPMMINPAAVRRDIVLSGLPLNARTLMMLPRRLRGSSMAAEIVQ